MTVSKSALEIWLELVRSLVWPATVIFAIAMFRAQIISLIDRLSSFEGFGVKMMAFQQAAPDARESPPVKKADVVTRGTESFLTETGVRTAIRQGADLAADDEIYRTMRIFSTQSQTTWLAFSKQKVFLLLDDASTRASGLLVQWVLPRDQASPVLARPRSPGLGLLDIGPRKNWLYSTSLFASPEHLQKEITSAIQEGAQATA
ncbi:hypothetical protein [Sphingomonas sp. 28-63-12]|uniref:hypothetical protein n=1 Tax=Sphingomonas sp. 28-63-12 TaxID=1970434 RepID=UPI000BD50EB6|nr:MAG: hypothetical protein B7Y47_02700 [Sphingomonas sp. 28-63-12]